MGKARRQIPISHLNVFLKIAKDDYMLQLFARNAGALPYLNCAVTQLGMLLRARGLSESAFSQAAPLLPAVVIFPFPPSEGAICTMLCFSGQQITY